jgi:protein tyrosine/serine phosphatase
MRRCRSVAAAALLLGLGPACTNFHSVEDGRFYRSGQMHEIQLRRWIEEHRLRTVVRLRGRGPGDASYEASSAPAKEAGIAFVQIPMSANEYPSREQLLALWDLFEHGEYPMLVHCRGGADRSGLASALYLLQRTGDLELARAQLAFFPYLHLGWGRTGRLPEVLDRYAPYHGRMSFPDWVREVYEPRAP